LPVNFFMPVTDHEASDNCGVEILGDEESAFWKDHKGAKIKVQVSIQGSELRMSGKKRDDLQKTIAFIKEMNIEQPLQYVNFRD